MLVLIHLLPSGSAAPGRIQATVLNFGAEPVTARLRSEHFRPGAEVTDLVTGRLAGRVEPDGAMPVSLEAHEGRALLLQPQL